MTLEEQVVGILRERGLRIAVAESCTGGLLGHRLTNVPGSSTVFPGGIVAYHNGPKRRFLGVDAEILREEGAVSAAAAQAMAAGARSAFGADYGLALTGIAGPDGGSEHKPAGTVFIALAGPRGERVEHRVFADERLTYKYQATDAALRLLLTSLASSVETQTTSQPPAVRA